MPTNLLSGVGSAVLAAVVTSSVVAAMVTGLLAERRERRSLLRDRRITLSGEFASAAMAALAALRHYKPTKPEKPGPHFNEALHQNPELRQKRADAATDCIDQLRLLRGPIWVLFPGWTVEELEDVKHLPDTTADFAEYVVGNLVQVQTACRDFWTQCDTQAAERQPLEEQYNKDYKKWKESTWTAVRQFSTSAATRIEATDRFRRLFRPLRRLTFGLDPQRTPGVQSPAPSSHTNQQGPTRTRQTPT
jgi:hypothetical protein